MERATECDCPICGDYMFNSSASVVAMKCGHYIHRGCYDAYMNTSYKCPICNRSAVNMELQWRKLDAHIASQPMPEGWREARAWVVCNDCMGKSWTPFHWLGNKCATCDSYNTMELKVINGPGQANVEREERIQPTSGNELGRRDEDTVESASFPSIATSTHENVVQTAAHSGAHFPDAIARSAESVPTNASSHAETASEQTVQFDQPPRPPIHTGATAAGPPPPLSFLSNATGGIPTQVAAEVEMTDAEPCATDEQEVADDDLTFWGEAIGPSSWSLPRALSPAGGWGSPRLFAVGGRKRSRENEEEARDDAPEVEEGGSSDESMGESEAWEEEEDEEGEEDAMELLGHR